MAGNATFKVQVELGSIGDGFTANDFEIFCDDPESGKCHFDTLLQHTRNRATTLAKLRAAAANVTGVHLETGAGNDRPPVPYYQQGLYTAHTCLPVTESLFSADNDLTRSVFNQYSDTTLGISDPNIFTRVPTICHDAPLELMQQQQQQQQPAV